MKHAGIIWDTVFGYVIPVNAESSKPVSVEYVDNIIEKIGIWTPISAQNPAPKTKKEFLVRNDLQGGTIRIIYYNAIYSLFHEKGLAVSEASMGTHYFLIPV